MEKILLWGTGKIAKNILEDCLTLDMYDIVGIIDNDCSKWGVTFYGKIIYSPDILKDHKGIKVIVLTNAYEEIRNQIETEYKEYNISIENKYFFYKESLLRRYEETDNTEVAEVIEYVKKYGLGVFNYPFTRSYEKEVCVKFEEEAGLYYVIHNGKKMYFSSMFDSKEKVNEYYKSLLIEQDYNSPHRYLSDDLNVEEGDIVVDVGTAEGNFAIEVIEKVSKIYLIESDENWIKALKYTFKDYAEKVVFIKGFVSSYCDRNRMTLDSVIHTKVNFIKMDIEGNEWDALKGAERLIQNSSNVKLAICSYHSDFDQDLIEYFMDKHNIRHWTSKGYMWFPEKVRQTYISTKLNRGVVFGIKNDKT